MPINYFNGAYQNRKVLITGHTGFKGTWLTCWLNKLGANVFGLSLKEERTHFDLLKPEGTSFFGDIRNLEFVNEVIQSVKPEIIFHLAAQSLVSESYLEPMMTYHTNLNGSLNILEAVRKNNKVKALIMVTTDKVYENNSKLIRYKENDSLGGYDPYSSSKACVEILTQSYRRSFFETENKVFIASVRAGNVIGGGDWAQNRLIPDLIRGVSENKPTFIRMPSALRPWQHVLDPLSGYLMVGQNLLEEKKEFATAWNFGPVPSTLVPVSKVVMKMKSEWSKLSFQLNNDSNQPFHESDKLLLNCENSLRKLRWFPAWDLEDAIHKTVDWYRTLIEKNTLLTTQQLDEYLIDAKSKNLKWCR